ncbi:MAG: gliding motility-associated C-terminal domain-containing protein [Bacteroidota bacterium]
MFLAKASTAQLCTGSLGDPVVNITFGSGSNPGQPLPGSVTNYIFVSTACPQDGFYTIVNSTANCFSGTWNTVTEDHTPGDVNGYMMLVNASVNPGVFYLDTVKNLCGGTTYEFSAWITSVLTSSACSGNGIHPNITFNIETTTGTVIQTINTGNISNLSFTQWNQYGIFFTLPTGVSDLVLRLTNNAPGGCGNDLALDDITFRPCGPKVDAAFVNVNGTGDTANYCITDNKTIIINGDVQTGYNNPAFQWQQSTDGGATWLDIAGETKNTYAKTFSASGKFLYRMSAAESGNIDIARCRVASNVLTIVIDAIPVPAAGNSSPACVNTPVTLSAKNGYTYAWAGPNGFNSSDSTPVIASATVNNTGKYYVLVTTIGGCSKQDSTNVFISALPLANAGNDTSMCESTSITLHAAGGTIYRWLPATGLSDTTIANPMASPSVTTTYTVAVGNQYFCFSKDTVVITVLKKPLADAGPDKKITEGQSTLLNGVAGGDTASYFWSPPQFISSTTILAPVVNPVNDFTYTLHVLSGDGCGVATDDVFVRVFKKIAIPNAFSPNGDGINDVWNIEALETYPESDTQVFNRYGQLVFHSKGYNTPWNGTYNGKPLPVGTYYYTIDRKNNFPVLNGWIMLIR